MFEACSPSLRYGVPALNPGMPFSRMKAEMPLLPCAGSVTAITTATCATPALVMKALVPLRTQLSPSRVARVFIAAASEPEPGSVSPHAPSVLPLRERGQILPFCSGEPKSAMWLVQSELWAHIVMPTEPSTRLSSSTARA